MESQFEFSTKFETWAYPNIGVAYQDGPWPVRLMIRDGDRIHAIQLTPLQAESVASKLTSLAKLVWAPRHAIGEMEIREPKTC